MIDGAADLNMLFVLTRGEIDRGDKLIERHSAVQRECADHAVELQKLIEAHARIGQMLAQEKRRFASYFPQEEPRARIAAAGQNARTPADAPQSRT